MVKSAMETIYEELKIPHVNRDYITSIFAQDPMV